MVGAEWRKASRVYEDLREKIKTGASISGEAMTATLFQAWDCLPQDFREKIEKRIYDKQYGPVREQVERDLDLKTKQYEGRIKEFKDAEMAYRKEAEAIALERMKFENKQTAVRLGEAFAKFCQAVGVGTNARWYDIQENR